MKILHYINNLGSGGAEKLLSDILPIMKDNGHEVHLAISNSKKNSFIEDIIKEKGINMINFNTSFYNPILVIKLIFLLRKEKYDIVHAHLFPSQYWLAFASFFMPKRTKLIKTEHSVFNERKNYKILKPLEKLVYSRYSVIIAISDQVKNNLASWLGDKHKIVVIENGVNLSQIRSAQQSKSKIDYSFINQNDFNILMVGRFDLDNQKDQSSLIKALALLPDKFKLFLAGEGGKMEEVKNLTENLGLTNRITFLGLRSDVYKLMSLVNLNVLSTNHEGFSGVTLESLASGKPFIGSDVEGVNNVVPSDLFLFKKQSPETLADKIKEIADNDKLQIELVNTGLEYVKQHDTNYMVQSYIKQY